jgi:hypothetical protein
MAGWGKRWDVARKLRVQYPGKVRIECPNAIYATNRVERSQALFGDDDG